jgi:hypothetical protein
MNTPLNTLSKFEESFIKFAYLKFHNYSMPLIISIEDHCNLDNQKKMAFEFQKIFGGKLNVLQAYILTSFKLL